MRKLMIAVFALAALSLIFAACEKLEDEINDAVGQTESFDLDITDEPVPMYAIEQAGYKLTAVCYSETVTINTLMSATDYADLWNSAKSHIDDIEIKDMTYKIGKNRVAEGGNLDIFLLSSVPSPLVPPDGVDIDLSSLDFVLVDPTKLPNDKRIARIEIPAGTNVNSWTDATFLSGGESELEDQLLDFTSPFAFCLRLAVPTHGVELDMEPDLEIELATSFDVTLTPL
ncbi:MAG: hypothetical protein P9L99_15915 [Candidatus Lernaella stagnicola]|nr:hypothetical protein [Candidatus Lernaella stagnicola]